RLPYSGSPYAVFFDGCLLLDAGRGNLPLPVCCESLQRWRQIKNVPWNFMGPSRAHRCHITNCWMSSANGLIWIFIVFVVLVEFFNILILGRVIKEMVTMQQEKDKHSEQIRIQITRKSVCSGTCWMIVLLSFIFSPIKNDEKNLEILTYVGLTLSVIGISLTIISYVTLTTTSPNEFTNPPSAFFSPVNGLLEAKSEVSAPCQDTVPMTSIMAVDS
ncbi:hypothetical protein pdam_00024906, partial [Pocillopora damicornis]